MRFGKVGERGDVGAGVTQHRGDRSELLVQGLGDDLDVRADSRPGGRDEHRPSRGGDHLGLGLPDPGQDVAHGVHPAALPGRALQDGLIALTRPQWLSLMTSWTPV